MPGSSEDFGDLKKKVSWDLNSERKYWDSSLEESRRFLVSPRGHQLGSTKCAARLLKKLCLSLLISKNLNLKKVIKGFVPEPKKSRRVFRVFRIPIRVWKLWTFYEHMYISRVRILVDFVDPLYITTRQKFFIF